MANIIQRTFAGGEISPSLYARVDLAKYATSVRKLLNFIVRQHGGITNRPGTKFRVAVKDSTKTVRLIKFQFNASQTYVLEFGNQYIRFIKAGAQLVSGGVPYEISTPYVEADLMDLQFVQSADVITIVHPTYTPRELSRTADTTWKLSEIVFGASIGSPVGLALAGGNAGAIRYYAVTAVDSVTGEEGLPTFISAVNRLPSVAVPTTISWTPLLGAGAYRVYRSTDGATYELLADAGGTPTVVIDTTWTTTSSSIVTTTANAWVPAVTQARNPVVAGSVSKPIDSTFTIKGSMMVACGPSGLGATSGRVRVYYSRDAEVRVDAGIVFTSSGVIGNASNTENFTGAVVVPDNGYAALTIDLVPEVFGYNGGGDTFEGTVSFTVAPYNAIERSTIGSGFSDDGTDGDPLQTPPKDRQLFNGVGKYPSAVTYYQQRRMFANSNLAPETVWASRTGAYKNFYISTPLQDDDAVTFSMAGSQVNAVRHLIDLQRLLVLTTGAEISVEGDQAGILRPTDINPRQFSYNGSSPRPPLKVVNSALYIQARGTKVKDIIPEGDSYTSSDLTLLASHMFDGYTLVDCDFAQEPNSVGWFVRSDGALLGLTYIPDQDIWGWHRHTTAGTFERVCTVAEGTEDVVYFVIARTIGGVTKRYIESMASRFFTAASAAFFVDSGLSYSGAPATVFAGLGHLEGKQVSILADGVVVANPNDTTLAVKTVVAGSVTLAVAASVVHIGLPYLSDIQTLDIDTLSSTLKDKKVLINKVGVFVEASAAFWAGIAEPPSAGAADVGLTRYAPEIPWLVGEDQRVTDMLDVIINSVWNRNGRVFIRNIDPLPLTILGISPQGNIG